MKEIKLRECPCCGGESKFRSIEGASGRPISVCVCCTKCGLETKFFKVSADYCAKEEAAKVWNKRHTEINQDNFGGITADELERALEECVKELVAMKNPGEEKYRETPKCPICGHRGYNIREIDSDAFNTYVLMVCRNCGTEIRTDKEKIDKFFLERLVQDIEK